MNRRLRSLFLAFSLSVASAAALVSVAPSPAAAESPAREISIVVDEGRYQPARIEMKEGEKVRLVFLRKEHNPCTREVLIPALNIRRELPPDQPVAIEVSGLKPGTYEFHCGMKMVYGQLVVTAG